MSYNVVSESLHNVEIITLEDTNNGVKTQIVPKLGNLVYSLQWHQQNYLWSPHAIKQLLQTPNSFEKMCGIPFLAPWANRLGGDQYFINDTSYSIQDTDSILRDENSLPIHGLLLFSDAWKIIETSNDQQATLKTKLEFWRYPEYMQHYPFAHTIIMTYTLKDAVFYIACEIHNHMDEPLPVCIGFHPYFQLPTSKTSWSLSLPQKALHIELNDRKLPTESIQTNPYTSQISLHHQFLDEVFIFPSDHNRPSRWIFSDSETDIVLTFGPNYNTGVVYNPVDSPFVCIEPMTAVTNAFNLAHQGTYQDLQSIPPKNKWSETFSIEVIQTK